MKSINWILSLGIIVICIACDENPDGNFQGPGFVEEPVFEIQWATQMDSVSEIISTENTTQYKDVMIVGFDFPTDLYPRLRAFNKVTGDLDWELKIDVIDNDDINSAAVFENLYLAVGLGYVFAVDLDEKELLWYEDLSAIGFRIANMNMASNGKLYVGADFSFGPNTGVLHIIEFDPYTGDNRTVYGAAPDSTGVYSRSPVAIYHDESTAKDLIVFNLYTNSWAPPETGEQYLVGVDPENPNTEIFRIFVADEYASNGGHPPVIFGTTVITGASNMIHGFDIITKEKIWEYSLSNNSVFASWSNTRHLAIGDRLVVNSIGPFVSCISMNTGTEVWTNELGGANCTENMLFYEKENALVFTSWGFGSVMVLDATSGKEVHKEIEYDFSAYNNDIVYDEGLDMFFTSTFKHAIGFKVQR